MFRPRRLLDTPHSCEGDVSTSCEDSITTQSYVGDFERFYHQVGLVETFSNFDIQGEEGLGEAKYEEIP